MVILVFLWFFFVFISQFLYFVEGREGGREGSTVEGQGLNNDVKEGLEKGSRNMHFLFHESKKIPHYPPAPLHPLWLKAIRLTDWQKMGEANKWPWQRESDARDLGGGGQRKGYSK
jgi:hypothetical protein